MFCFCPLLQSLKGCMVPTQKMISNLIQIELAYINTSHPDFIGGKQVQHNPFYVICYDIRFYVDIIILI